MENTTAPTDSKQENSITEREPIAAIATPVGEGGIAVIRVSGQEAIAKVNSAFQGTDLATKESHTVHFGNIVDAEGAVVDEVLVTLFQSPKSYTGEETVEISCHGGVLVTQAVLETILALGVRSAEAGEFTQRAFLNGKMELSQAEAVADLIHAKSAKALDAAHQQLEGKLGKHIKEFRQQIIDATAMVELELDFVEEDVEFANKEQLHELLTDLDEEIDNLLATYETGRLVKHGVRTVFIGLPNAGKSTLLNTLVGKDRAIVTDIAGTTRDTIDVDWSYDGIRFILTDTAGLRETEDVVEAEGVKRSQKAFEEADLAVYLKDLSQTLTPQEREDIAQFQQAAGDTPFVLIGTKNDIALQVDDERMSYDLKISALEGEKVDALKQLMKQRALENKHYDASSLLVTSSRHRDALQKAQQNVTSAIRALDQGMTGDFLSIDLRSALKDLGTITGEITTEDVLDSIFSRFCIGK
ncbi:tRNA uridine-5-carboxymethylaminomethyl(34) synthesis GTPase MnmE [Aliifodinibius sp. 1BSP15-2V2]|uniref:tRNA modification GTPase MnmE n=2 Tax=Fodinibius salsisoli TaxID=2820877 RepID=A0ABT3PRH8_9BACT|nr:tRNA uridine-5-carboxymethylaminomethyl(34) synthesis GTPase MnmE [Fodinibius salsisoli]